MALSASRGQDSRDQWDGGPSVEGSAGAPHVLDGTGAASVQLPDASFLTDGQFVRSGADLKIELPDGRTAVVEGYFQGTESPDLVGPDGGGVLSPALVQSFLGSLTPGQYAQAAPSAAAQPIGQVDALDGQATAVRTDGTRIALEKGDPVFQGDVIETGGDGSAVRLLFADKTMFALGPEARLALDEMVFDSASQEGSVQFSILKGVFIFASGQIAKTDNTDMTVTTPVATIGIRGTEVAGRVAEGDSQFTIIDGAIEVTTRAGSVALDNRGETTDVTGIDSPPGTPYLLTPTQYAEAYKAVAGIAADYFGGGAPRGGEVPDGDKLDQDGDSADRAAVDDDSGTAVLARTLGGDTDTLFGSTGSSGEAWSDPAVSTDWTANTISSDGAVYGGGSGGSTAGGMTASGSSGSDPVLSGSGSGTVSDGTTAGADGATGTTSQGADGDPLFGLASDLTLDGGLSSGGPFDFSSSGDSGFGASPSPLRAVQGENTHWDAGGGPHNADADLGWSLPGSANAAQSALGGNELDDEFENEFEELALLAGSDAAPDQEILAEGITLVVSHKSINGNSGDISASTILPDLGPGSSATITGSELGLTGAAGNAEIALTRDAIDSVDVTLNSAWNSIQNIRIESDAAGDVEVSNFVHADVQLGDGGDSQVTITGAKRGSVATGDGDDWVSITAVSDGAPGSTSFDVWTSSGDDTLVFSGAAGGKSVLTFDGGVGADTLRLTGPETDFDLTSQSYDLAGVERLDVSGDADVSVTLSADLIAAITEDYNDFTASAKTLVIDGDAGDSLDLGDGWSASGSTEIDGAGYTIYEHADGVSVVADSDIAVV